jgi:hypothetical protein
MAEDYEREKRDKQDIVISDRRHARDLEAEAEDQEPVQEEPAAQEPAEVVEFKPPQRETEKPAAKKQAETPPAPPAHEAQIPDDSPEAAQLRMLFEAGLPAYLHSQLQLLLNFAMIYLGRQPNPATGLVSTDNDKARLAIDLFDFIITRTAEELPEQDRAGLTNLVAGLKMEYAQSLKSGAKPGDEQADS